MVAGLALPAIAQCPRLAESNLAIVPARWLATQSGVTVLAVAPRPSFERAHIPGARRLAPEAIANPSAMRTEIRHLGLASGKRVVLYQNDGPPVIAARAWAMFDALGMGGTTSVLDGGLHGWVDRGGAVAVGPVPAAPAAGPEPVLPCSGALVDRAFVSRHLGDRDFMFVDARLPAYFDGIIAEPDEPVGHIPGAVNLPFTQLVESSGYFVSPADMRTRFRQAGVSDAGQVILYCHSGNKAAITYLAARVLGVPARLYLGSWRDWSAGL